MILAPSGPVVIDWIDASVGNPLADVARTAILAEGELAAGGSSPMQKLAIRLLYRSYLRHTFRLRPGAEDAVRHWRALVAAGRLSEGIVELESWLLEQATG